MNARSRSQMQPPHKRLLFLFLAAPLGLATTWWALESWDEILAAGPGRRAAVAVARETAPRLRATTDSGERASPSVAALQQDRGRGVDEVEPERSLEDLVADLRHDDERWNALRARSALARRMESARPLLEAALRSNDRQQRQLAAGLLYSRVERPDGLLLGVAVEGLQHDRLPFDPGWPDGRGETRETSIRNARAASLFLDRFPDAARSHLLLALRARDRQQRLLAAMLLAEGTRGDGARLGAQQPVVVAVLCEHLGDNGIQGDAVLAASALARLGPSARPLLEAATRRADAQARAFLGFLAAHRELLETTPGASASACDPAAQARLLRAYDLAERVNPSRCFACRSPVGRTPLFYEAGAGVPPAPPF